MKPVIVQEGLAYQYSDRPEAIRFPDLSLQAGEALAVSGPSGCGKSTWLNLLAGCLSIQQGEVRILDTAWKQADAETRSLLRGRRIGMVQQDLGLIPFLTVRQNLTLPLELCGNELKPERIRELLEQVELWQVVDELPTHLSRGEQQRVAICRALMHEPDLLLADEPTGSLDGRMAEKMCSLLLSERARLNAAMVMTTHDPSVLERFERRVELVR